MKSTTTSERTPITVNLVGRKGAEDSVIQTGRITIDLKKLEEGINTRHHIFKPPSWSNVYLSLVASATIDGQATTKRDFYNEMLPLFKQACRKGNIALEATKLNGENPAPSAGYAKAICQYFDLPNTSPRLKKLLLETERESIKKGKRQREETAKYSGKLVVGADDGGCEKTVASNEEPSVNEAALEGQNPEPLTYEEFVNRNRFSRAQDIATDDSIRRPTYLPSGIGAHTRAHRAVREMASEKPPNPFQLILETSRGARGELGLNRPGEEQASSTQRGR